MAHSNLQQRVALLQQSLKHTAQLINRLAKTQSPLSTQPPDVESSDSHATLSAEIHDILAQGEEELELLQQEVGDLAPFSSSSGTSRKNSATNRRAHSREHDYGRLNTTCNKLGEELKLARIHFRRAQLQSKRNAELSFQREHHVYLAELQATAQWYPPTGEAEDERGLSHGARRHNLLNLTRRGGRTAKNATQEDVILTASSDLTNSLRHMHDMLSSEVSRSRFAQDTLAASNTALLELNKRYGTLDDMLSRSRGLLGSLLRSQKSDTWYLETALYLLLVTIGWLLFRRLLYGPAWWLFWQPLRLFWTFTTWLFSGILGLSGTNRGVLAVNTTAKKLAPMPSPTMVHYSNADGLDVSSHVSISSIHHNTKSVERGYRSSQENTELDLSVQVEAVIDGTRTGSANNENTVAADADEMQRYSSKAGEEKVPAEEQPENSTQNKQGRKGEIKRGDGEVLQDRYSKENPSNPGKKMWEEAPSSN